MSKVRSPAAKAQGRGRIGKSEQPSPSRSLPANAAVFLIVFELRDVTTPRFEMEFGARGAVSPAYLPDIRRWFREEWRRSPATVDLPQGCVALEGFARYEHLGFPDADKAVVRQGMARVVSTLRRTNSGDVDAIQGAERDCEVRIWRGPPSFVDRFAELWKVGAADSSSGMWDQLLVPSSRRPEESRMHVASQAPTESVSPPANLELLLKRITQLNQRLTAAERPIQEELQSLLNGLTGASFGSLEANVAAADALRFLMLRLEVRVKCPREGCGEAALIRCRPAGRTRHGSFAFEHQRGARVSTHAASTRLPVLELVPAPVHRKRKVR